MVLIKIIDDESYIVVVHTLVLSLTAILPLTNPLISLFLAKQPTDILLASSYMLIAAFFLVHISFFVFAPEDGNSLFFFAQ